MGFRGKLRDSQTKSAANRDLGWSWWRKAKVFQKAINRQMENNRATHTHTHTHSRINMKVLQTGQSSPSIYHTPSVFFKELVERDRGLRMILMAWLFLPHPHTLHLHTRSHAYTHTPPSGPPGALWPALRCALKWSSGSLLLSQVCRAPSEVIPRCSRSSSSSDRLTVGGCLAWFLSLSRRRSLALFLSRRISEWYWSVLIQPCTHSVALSHSASLFQVPVFCFVFPDWCKYDLLFLARCFFSFPSLPSSPQSLLLSSHDSPCLRLTWVSHSLSPALQLG